MSTLEDYELAALASDAYHRGYHAGMPDLGGSIEDGLGSSLQFAVAGGVIVASSSILGLGVAEDADFYAVAYLFDGEVVISYRGSDNLFGEDAYRVNALWNGQAPDQLLLALEFFNHVRDLYPSTPITLTGHSLGGALAGAVATLKNVDAVIFDNTAFEAAAANIASKITSTQADFDQALFDLVYNGAATPWSSFGTGNISAIALENDIAGYFRVGRTVDDVDMGTPLLPQDAHMMGLLVLALYARSHYGSDGAWLQSANAVFTQLSSDAIAAALGIEPAHDNPGSGVMKDMIASTVLPGDDNPFGTSAASSLANDMQDLGAAAASGVDIETMAGLIVRYAALQAQYSISESSNPGFLTYDSGSWLLGADLTQAKWTFDGQYALMDGVSRDFSGYLSDKTLSSTEIAGLDQGPSRFEYEFYSSAVAGWQGQVGFESADYTVKVVGTDTLDTIIGTDGDEFFLLGGGDDQVKANGGVNWIDGGAGEDRLIDDFAWAEYEIKLDFGRYYFALRSSGADPRIHVLDSVELFKLDGHEFDATNILNVAPTDMVVSSLTGGSGGLVEGTVASGAVIGTVAVSDLNEYDRFTWEVLGDAAALYSIDSDGVVRASTSITYSYAAWRAQVGAVTYSQWQAEDFTAGFSNLLGTQYGFTTKVTDSYGVSWTEDVFLFLQGGSGTLIGTPGVDVLQGGVGKSIVAGLGSGDTITDNDWLVLDYSASDAAVRIALGQTNGRMLGYGGHAEGDVVALNRNARLDIIGSSFGDTLTGTSAGSYNYGHMLNGNNEIHGGGGNDIIEAGSGTNWLYGDDGDDTITGGGGYDEIYGGDGYDIINASGGTNYVDFGTGGGELKLPDNYAPYYANLETREFHYKDGQAGTTTTVVGEFDKITGTNYDDEIHGSSGNDRIYGGGGPSDILSGGAGDDFISGRGTLSGGGDNDEMILSGLGSAWGDSGNDKLTTSTQHTTLYGGADNDILTSGTNYVMMIGGTGSDTFIGPAAKVNTISYEFATAGVGLDYNGTTGFGWAGEATGDTLQGNFSFKGSSQVDHFNIKLNSNSTELRAGAGDDVLNVEFGSYTEVYGDGLSDLSGTDNDIITTTGGGYGKVFGGRGDDIISGTGELHGDTGADTITSAAGNHNIYLGADDDIDTFVFSRLQGFDRIYDFTWRDVIDIGPGYKYDDFEDILTNSNQVGNNIEILFDSNTKLTIAGYSLSSLTAANFDFT